jgi:hypothetical protein
MGLLQGGAGPVAPAPAAGASVSTEQLIDALATAFFDAKLRGDARAAAWLAAYCGAKHAEAAAEFKPAAAAK